MSKADYYEVLGVDRGASDQELKSAYRRLAKTHHPDINPGNHAAEEKFKEASEAYQVLSDPDKRAAYDRYGHAAFSGAGSGFGGGSPFAGGVDISDIFGEMFGEMFSGGATSGRRGSRQQRGDDLRYDLTIEFEAAVFGTETEVKLRRREACTSCHGTGSAGGKAPVTCGQCRGTGQVRFQQGFFAVARSCGACGGTGSLINDPCTSCRGETRVTREFKLKVKIPAGVEEGTRIRYSGEGDAGRFDGQHGDLYIVLTVKPHAFYERHGNDLHCVVPISIPQAILGDEVVIEGIDGPVTLKIPEGTQSGKEIKLRGKGVPHLNESGRGDMVIQLSVQTPRKLTKAQRDLVKQLQESMAIDNKPTSRSLLNKMKDLFS